jgi:excisionase family DNA binding protein
MVQARSAESRTVSVRHAAAQLGIGGSTLYRLIKDGKCPVPVIRIGERVVLSRAGLERVIAEGTRDWPARAPTEHRPD